MSNVLVVFYSRTGFTRRVAAEIARDLGCDVLEIEERRPRRGWHGYLRSAVDVIFGRLPPIKEKRANLQAFDLVILGSPVWLGHLSSPVRSFIVRHRDQMRSLAAFCTLGGASARAEGTLREIEQAAQREVLAHLVLTDDEIKSGSYQQKLRAFTNAIRVRLPDG